MGFIFRSIFQCWQDIQDYDVHNNEPTSIKKKKQYFILIIIFSFNDRVLVQFLFPLQQDEKKRLTE